MAEKFFEADINLQGNKLINAVLEGVTGLPKKKKHEVVLTAGQLAVTLPELPDTTYTVVAEINGLAITFTLVGVNFTITEYTSGTVEAGWNLKIFYFK